MIKSADLDLGEGELWWRTWCCAIDHGQPINAPANDAEDSDQIDEPVGRPQFRLFSPATRFEYFVKHLNLPALGIPIQFLNSFLKGAVRAN